jgi:ubiquinone/menaquinone biosynthesis C-methylase UbiE
VLSFRYLDCDPVLKEILRVLKPGGRFMVIDMVAAPVRIAEWPFLLRDKVKERITRIRHPAYARALAKMVRDARWKRMLEFNPIRSEHEMKWYLESRFPGGKLEIINTGWNSRVLAFQSASIFEKTAVEMSYP